MARRQIGEPPDLVGVVGQWLERGELRGQPRHEIAELRAAVLRPVVVGHGTLMRIPRSAQRRLRRGDIGGRIKRHVEVGVGEEVLRGRHVRAVLVDLGLRVRAPPGLPGGGPRGAGAGEARPLGCLLRVLGGALGFQRGRLGGRRRRPRRR